MIAGRMDVEGGRRAADSGLWPRLNQEPPPWPQQGSQGGSSLRLSVELDLFGHGLAGMAYGRRTRVIQVTMAHVKGGDRKFLPRPFAGTAKSDPGVVQRDKSAFFARGRAQRRAQRAPGTFAPHASRGSKGATPSGVRRRLPEKPL